jgi:tight adherence protein B
MATLWVSLFFAFFVITMIAVAVGLRFMESKQKEQVNRVLRTVAPLTAEVRVRPVAGYAPSLEGAQTGLLKFPAIRTMQEWIYTAGLTWKVEGLLGLMAILAVGGAILGWRWHVLIYPDLSSAAMALIMGSLPVLFVKAKRKKRLEQFEKQFPEALDFISRSVRAGHAFSVSLELLANETEDPLRSEFRRVFQELNLGSDFETAMTNLTRRVPLVDIRFFVSTILMQRETGGNLTEMLMKLSHVIRERFQVKGQVKSHAAHGKITATILSLMPFVLAFGLSIVSPAYLPSMANDPLGKKLIVAALLAQLLGFYIMRKIVNIEI